MIQLRKSIQLKENPLKITIDALRQKKAKNEKFASVTCYDSTFAQVSDAAGIEVFLVGDSLGMVIQGGNSTLPVTVEDICYHTKAVASQTKNALIMSDMPFMGARTLEAGLDASMKLMQAGAHMIKLEGDASLAPLIKTLKSQGVPVCVHLGLTPQAVHSLSGFKAQAKENLALLDGQMEGKEFICGNNFTLADIMLFCFLHFGTTVGQDINPELKNINSWFEKVKERPSTSV